MAQTALPAPRAAVSRRAFFGLFEADGWSWAIVKSLFWFVLIIMVLGYIPDRAYYFTVQKTVDVGLLAWSPVNFCPPENETLPCPAPAGATLPWHQGPQQVSLPAARTDGAAGLIGTTYLFAGGSDGTAATADVYASHPVGTGNIDKWSAGPALPEARSDAAFIAVGNTFYVIGGLGPDGKPTTTTYSISVATDGTLGAWTAEAALALPEARAGSSAVPVSDGIVLLGGTNGTAATQSVWKSKASATGALQAWTAQAPLFEANTDGYAAHVGDVITLVGGINAKGETVATVQQGLVGGDNAPATDPNAIVALWRASAQTNLPGPRSALSGFSANGVIYINGAHAFVFGGTTTAGPNSGSARAYLAPQEPFFQLGLLGATIPGLKLDGEIGQQIGYLNAATVGALNFVLMLIVAYAFNHKEQVRALLARRRRRKD